MIKKLDWSKDNIVAYEASGVISKQEHEIIFSELAGLIAKYDKLRIFVRLPKIAWPSIDSIPLRFSFSRKFIGKIDRYAVVSNSKILPWVIDVADGIFSLFTQARYRHYCFDDEIMARTWLEAKHT